MFEIKLEVFLQVGDYELSMTFIGDINDHMAGFYRNKYTTPDGKETRYGASTDFEVKNHFFFKSKILLECYSLLIVDEHFHVGMNRTLNQHLI